MKKAILILGMAAVLTAAVYSQSISFSGYLNSGLGVASNDVNGADPVLSVRANDAEQNGFRFRLNGQYTNEARTAGARFRFQMQGGGINPTISHAWGWVNFFDGVLQLNGGRIEESTWQTGDFWLSSDSVSRFSGNGALLKITPIDGLILGAGAYVGSRDAADFSRILEDARFTGHIAYTLPDVLRFDFSYRTESTITGTGDGTSAIYADIRLLAVNNLTAVAAVHFNRLEDFSDTGTITLSETFGYKIGDGLNIGLNAVQFLSNVNNYDVGLFFNPWITYSFGNIIPRLDVVYFIAGRSMYNGGSLDNNWFRHGFAATGNNDNSVLNIRPSVTINIDNRIKLEIGDSVYFDNGAVDVITNVFYIDLIWSF